MSRILVVEDDRDIAMFLNDDLTAEGHTVEVVRDGPTASRRGVEAGWDLIVVDVMLPGRDGFDVCRDIRTARVRTPIIMLTAKTHEAEKILGLDLGADDYVTKPFSPRELRSRIRAVLRRVAEPVEETFRFGDVEIDFARDADRAHADRVQTAGGVRPKPRPCLEPRAVDPGRVGRADLRHRTRRRRSHRLPAAQDRGRSGAAPASRERPGAWLPARCLKSAGSRTRIAWLPDGARMRGGYPDSRR
jgi:CheY-like chemotaxis protein